MEAIKELFSTGNIVDICLFVAKPLAIFLIWKILVKIFMKLANGIFSKSKLDQGVQSFAKSAIKIILWVIAFIIIADMVGLNTSSLVTSSS